MAGAPRCAVRSRFHQDRQGFRRHGADDIAAFTGRISAWFEKPPAVFMCSAATRQGGEIAGVIDGEMTG